MKKAKRKINVLNEAVVFDLYALYQFLRKLTTPFDKTKAFELGIIDERGKILKKKKELKTPEEKKAYTWFDLLVWNLKKLIEKLPYGKTRLASVAAALFLLKEEKFVRYYAQDEDLLYEGYMDFLEGVQMDELAQDELIRIMQKMEEEDQLAEEPVNNVGSGAIAGANADDTVVKQKPKIDKHYEKPCDCDHECNCKKPLQNFKEYVESKE